MNAQDLTKLQIDRGAKSFGPRKRARWGKWAIGAGLVAAALGVAAYRSATAPVTVDVATVTSAFPSQGFTVLNATGSPTIVASTAATAGG